MKLLLTNDDGCDAIGLQSLIKASEHLGQLIVIAPNRPRSGCSHQVTTHESIKIEQYAKECYRISGTPADCVRIGLHQIMPDVDLVLAGINDGGNLGVDVHYSGTVAAVREAALLGVPGIAISQYHKKGHPIEWSTTIRWLQPLVQSLIQTSWTTGTFWNLNFPFRLTSSPAPEVIYCSLDTTPLPLNYVKKRETLSYSGRYDKRRYVNGTDVELCFRGKTTVTQLSVS